MENRFIAFVGHPLAVQVLACLCVPERDRVFRVTEVSTTSNTAKQVIGMSEPSQSPGFPRIRLVTPHVFMETAQLPLAVVSYELLTTLEGEGIKRDS